MMLISPGQTYYLSSQRALFPKEIPSRADLPHLSLVLSPMMRLFCSFYLLLELLMPE
jgi:hypothetical protein